jgi:hypothetical protein
MHRRNPKQPRSTPTSPRPGTYSAKNRREDACAAPNDPGAKQCEKSGLTASSPSPIPEPGCLARRGSGLLRQAGFGCWKIGKPIVNPSNDLRSGEKPLSPAAGAFPCPDHPVQRGRRARLALCTMLFVRGSFRFFTHSQFEAAKIISVLSRQARPRSAANPDGSAGTPRIRNWSES